MFVEHFHKSSLPLFSGIMLALGHAITEQYGISLHELNCKRAFIFVFYQSVVPGLWKMFSKCSFLLLFLISKRKGVEELETSMMRKNP